MPRVLFVDDHDDSRELFLELLKMAGLDVAVAADGPEALNLLLTERFDVAVLDIGLPGMNGIEVAQKAREALAAHTPFLIAMTGFSRGAVPSIESAGFDAHLVKPIDPATLVQTIQKNANA